MRTDSFQSNEQLNLAFEFVQHTSKNVFLTGKAGTGKTTFLHNLRKNTPKRMAIVAPTGVAAINAGGVTIHSFFQLPFGPYVPGQSGNERAFGFNKKFHKEKIKLIRSLDLLVIDEISMVRSDILDGIDDVLRRYRNHSLPFGGLQLLMIGDLHQLSPIIKDDEWEILKNYYDTGYFFGSRALQHSKPVTIELKEIFRQSDKYFISLLNKVRENNMDHHSLNELNERFLPDFIPPEKESYITLTTHNNTARNTNQSKLDALNNKLHVFTAEVKGDFSEFNYPTEFELKLKKDAQVMFVKNDISREKLFYNGKIGKITRIDDEAIYVKCPGESEIAVTRAEWKNIRYSLDANKQIQEDETGSFTQYPLKLAWAITIHKSQGLTFDKAIIDASASFAHGQVYVALSRCRNFEGMVLRSRITASSIKTDHSIAEFTNDIHKNLPGAEYLFEEKRNFQTALLHDLIDFSTVRKLLTRLKLNLEENISAIDGQPAGMLHAYFDFFNNEIFLVNEKFISQLHRLTQDENLPVENPSLQQRLQKAGIYYSERLQKLYEGIRSLTIESDNKTILKLISEIKSSLSMELFKKKKCFEAAAIRFDAIAYLQLKANAELDFENEFKATSKNKKTHAGLSADNNLYELLKDWRNEKAENAGVEPYLILQRAVLKQLSESVPANNKELAAIKGIGKYKLKEYGDEILQLINDYCSKNNIERKSFELPQQDSDKPENKNGRMDSKATSLKLFNEGIGISEIASLRGFTTGTIEGHLAYFVGTGMLDVFKLISKEKFESIAAFFKKNSGTSLTEAKNKLGADVSYSDLRLVARHLAKEK